MIQPLSCHLMKSRVSGSSLRSGQNPEPSAGPWSLCRAEQVDPSPPLTINLAEQQRGGAFTSDLCPSLLNHVASVRNSWCVKVEKDGGLSQISRHAGERGADLRPAMSSNQQKPC